MSVALAVLLLLVPVQAAQEDPDLKWREDYVVYQEISTMTDSSAQAVRYLEFLEEGPHANLLAPVAGGLLQSLQALTQAGKYDEVYPAVDRVIVLYPAGEVQAKAIGLEAAAMAGDSEHIVKYGEPIYEINPNSQIALLLARAYAQLENQPRMLEYGRIVLDSGDFPMAEIWSIAYAVLQDDNRGGRTEHAVELAREIRAGVDGAPEGVSQSDWNSIQVYMLDLIGRYDFQGGRFAVALGSYDEIVALESCNAKAWYLKGNAMLQIGEPPGQASAALARSVEIGGDYAAQARQLLESTAASNGDGAAASRFVSEALATARRQVASCN